MKAEKHVGHMQEVINAYIILLGKSKRMRPFGRPRCKCENIEMVIKEALKR
jgi:hypothetical protein